MATNLGETYNLATFVTNNSGVAVDATNVVLTITLPNSTTATPAVVHGATGVYTATYPTTMVGRHLGLWVGNVGTEVVEMEDNFDVFPANDGLVALATPAQLGALLQQPVADTDATALFVLMVASGMVRDFLQAQLDAVVGDVVLLDPINGATVVLPELPVTAVSKVETFDGTVWTTADPATYAVSKRIGIIAALPNTGVCWPYLPETWRVTYDHGYAVIPSTIVGKVVGVAARAYASPAGVDMERIGSYQVKYSMETGGFTPSEEKALARYVNPRIA